MNPIPFPEQNNVLAKAQPQFRPLPVCVEHVLDAKGKPTHARFTCRYELTDLELAIINKNKCLYINQEGQGFQPILPHVENFWMMVTIMYRHMPDKTYLAWVPRVNAEPLECAGITAQALVDYICELFALAPEQLYFKEKPAMAISESGLIDLP